MSGSVDLSRGRWLEAQYRRAPFGDAFDAWREWCLENASTMAAELEERRARKDYLMVADALLSESSGPEELAAEAMRLRAKLARLERFERVVREFGKLDGYLSRCLGKFDDDEADRTVPVSRVFTHADGSKTVAIAPQDIAAAVDGLRAMAAARGCPKCEGVGLVAHSPAGMPHTMGCPDCGGTGVRP